MGHRRVTRRLLHTSDLHLVSLQDKGCNALKEMAAFAVEAGVDLVLIAGDLFDHNRVDDDLVTFVIEELNRLPVPVAILAGNHDCLVHDSVFGRAELWQSCTNAHIFGGGDGEVLDLPDLGIMLWGKSIDTHEGHIHPLEGIPHPRKNGRWHVAMAHGYYVGAEPPHFPSYHITHNEIITSEWDYIAMGHVPTFACVCGGPVTAYYSGSPSITGTVVLVELSEEKGVVVTPHSLKPRV